MTALAELCGASVILAGQAPPAAALILAAGSNVARQLMGPPLRQVDGTTRPGNQCWQRDDRGSLGLGQSAVGDEAWA